MSKPKKPTSSDATPDTTPDTQATDESNAAATTPEAPETTEPAAADPWAEALAEQAATDTADESPAATEASAAPVPSPEVFKPLGEESASSGSRELDMIMDIPVRLSVELGRTKLTIKELLKLAQGSVVELDGLPGEPMDILINGYLIAQGEVVVVDDKYGIRIADIVTPEARLQKLNR